MKQKNRQYNQSGQALITLLFFMVIGIAVLSAAIAILYTNTFATTMTDQSQVAYYNAETGIEDAMLRILRNPSMLPTTAAYNPISGSTNITVSITAGVIKSIGTSGTVARVITVQPTYSGGILTFTNWREVNQ